jgi:hypothetical protein
MTILAVIACAAALEASACGTELSLTLMRDVVYQPERDSAVHPAAVALGAGFSFGSIGMAQVRLGGSGYWNLARNVDTERGSETDEWLRSVWVQVVPGVRASLFFKPLTAYGGIGLGGRSSAERRVDHDYTDYTDYHDRSVWAFDQTFLLGLGFELSSRFDINLEGQRPGLTVSSELIRRYQAYHGWPEPTEGAREDLFRVGWRSSAATGIGIGLRVKL